MLILIYTHISNRITDGSQCANRIISFHYMLCCFHRHFVVVQIRSADFNTKQVFLPRISFFSVAHTCSVYITKTNIGHYHLIAFYFGLCDRTITTTTTTTIESEIISRLNLEYRHFGKQRANSLTTSTEPDRERA